MHCLPDKQAENYFNSRPREGCDSAFANRNRHTAASTHAPASGCDLRGMLFTCSAIRFNSRTREWVRLPLAIASCLLSPLQFAHPVMGSGHTCPLFTG